MDSCSSVDLGLSKPTPIPVPRTIRDSSKKPIPLPRHRVLNNGVADQVDVSNHNESHEVDTVKNNLGVGLSKILKDEFKSATESVHERGKAVIEGTRSVGARFEKSMREMIDKRRSGFQSSLSKEEEDPSVATTPTSNSLPNQDIFQSISFQSPLSGGNDRRLSGLSSYTGSSDDSSSPSAPPPIYPPPPLPDESVYDEVQSVISSQSSTYEPYYCSSVSDSIGDNESYYEDVSMMRGQTIESPTPSNTAGASVLRTNSWCYFEPEFPPSSANASNPSLNDNMNSSDNIYSQEPFSTSRNQTRSCSSESPSLFGDLEKLHSGSEDVFDNESSSNSPGRLSSISVQNDLYNSNWEPPSIVPRRNIAVPAHRRPSPSVMFEFDPLYKNNMPVPLLSDSRVEKSKTSYNLPLAQALAPYGKINKLVSNNSIVEESDSDGGNPQGLCPVIPPRRYDSIAPTSTAALPVPVEPQPPLKPNQPIQIDQTKLQNFSTPITDDFKKNKNRPNSGIERSLSEPRDDNNAGPGKSRNTRINRWSSMKRAIKSVADGSRRTILKPFEDSAQQTIDRPNLSPQLTIHCGDLYKAGGDALKRDLIKRYCVLAEGRLSCYSDRNCLEVREVIHLDSILGIQLVTDHKVSTDGRDLHCFKLTINWKGRRTSHIFGWTGTSERKVWMQKILESLTPVFPPRISSDFDRAGWCFMKEGISGTWTAAWILLNKRTLFYCLNSGIIQEIDLRKARCIELQECGPNSPRVTEKGQLILVDSPGQSLYLQMDLQRETNVWRNTIKAASVENGPNLAQQQLTKEDIPAIVDKCISFVYAHGSMSEGIYRRSGANSTVERLLKQFRQDAWSVQLTRQEYTEYDVASVLKRFFRDLPESLLTTELHGELCEIAAGKCGSDRLSPYRKALEKLPPINFLTTRKLLGHLCSINEQQEKNLMPVDNLASIWGPTLLHTEGADSLTWSKVESSVVADLIVFYPSLFNVDVVETTRERRIQEALEKLHAGNSCPNKPSGDLKVWIHIGTRDSKNTANVTIGPQKLAEEVCKDLSNKMSVPPHELCLEEVVYGGALVRPLHHTERVLDTVLRWGYWSEAARRDNCLVLRRNVTLGEIAPLAKPPLTHSGELRFADQKSKSFKSYMFEFSQAKLSYYKDKSGSTKLGEWKIEDIVWYIGHEPKRNPQTRWAITFVDKLNIKKGSKETPFFGCTIAGSSKEELLKWMAAMLAGEYPQGILPIPALLHQ